MTDEELVGRISGREETALELLQEKYGTHCFGIAGNLLGDEQQIQEVMNDVWFQVWESIPTARPKNLKAYLAKAVRNTALHYIAFHNAKKRSGICVQLDELSECIPGRLSDCDVDTLHLRNVINQFLRTLKPEYRQIFVNRYWYGDSINALAKNFRCSENRIVVILHRVRKKLKENLEKEEIWL